MPRKILYLTFSLFLSFHILVTSAFSGGLPTFTALSAEADPHTGSANFAVPVEVPSGRGGIQPNIQLQYNSSSPNGMLGVGWNLELGALQRSAKGGVPRYDATDVFLLIHNGSVQELVLDAATGLYRGKVEGAFMRMERVGDHWELTDKSGIKYSFGEKPSSQEYDPADGRRIFRWCLDRVADRHGNHMTIDYFRDENILYPSTIRYTGNVRLNLPTFAQVTFEREPRPENEIDRYNAGFRQSTRYRISKILVSVDGHVQRRYNLVYRNSSTTGRSLLSSVRLLGSDGLSLLPPITLIYQTPKNPDFNYTVTSLNSSVKGDNLWHYRSDSSYDRGHENYGPCPPTHMCNGVNWGPLATKGDSAGNVSFSSGQDTAHWLWTYLYVDKATTLSVPYSTGAVDGLWLNGNYSQHVGKLWSLQPGYNLIEITLYHQHESFGFNLKYALANNVDLMSSATVILPQLSGDFNADGRTDIATFTAVSGKVDVERSGGTTFSAKATWINGFAVNGKLVTGDFNGDGRVDISGLDPATGSWRVALADGSKFNDQGTVWISGFGVNEEPSSGDFNGDGLADILTFYKASGNLYVRIALNKSGSFTALSGGQNILIGSDADAPLVGDFNGDGQIDFGAFNKSNGHWKIQLNTGDILMGLRPLPAVSGFGAGKNTVVADFNYDGLTDIGYYDDSTGKVVYRVSNGLSFAPAVTLPFVFRTKGPNTQIQSGDYNGDTLIDFAVYNLIGKLEIAFSNGVMPDILSSVENGIGGQSTITYDAAVHYPQTFLPFPIQVVKSITQSNGLGESYTINNSYEQGLWDAHKREFHGFGLVRTTDPDGNYVDTLFAQDDLYKGRVTEQRTYDSAGRLYSRTLNTWGHEEISLGSNFIYLKRKDNFVYDGNVTGRRSAEEFLFGETPQLGNLTRATQRGEVDLVTGNDIGNDTRTVETTYVHNLGSNWIVGLPRQTTVKDNSGAVVRQSWFYYDNQGNGAIPIKGLLTKKEDWAGTGNINPVMQYSYDAMGNLLTTTDPQGNTVRLTYDGTYHMFPLATENALGHKVSHEYYGVNGVPLSGAGFNGLWGQLKSTTDPNNQAGKRVYDVFGRMAATISPLDSLAFPTQTTAIEFLGSYTKVTTRQRIEHGKAQTIDTVSFVDGFGRLAQVKARSEVNGQYVINGQTQYDSRGLKKRQYLPAFTTNPMDVIDAIDTTSPHTHITYDPMGRLIQTTNPDGTFASISYDDWTTTTIDENGHQQRSYFDAYGRLIKKEEYTGADGRSPHYPVKPYALYATTWYFYDSEGNLIQTKDAYNNITTITYDTLGRKITLNDLDMGQWRYQYDLAGNLIKQIDAKGQTLTFMYDALNRLIHKGDGIGGLVNVHYAYDNASSTNSKGRLTQATYTGGNTQFTYDELGRELQSIKTINTQNYSVNRRYDALNNLVQIQYPDQKGIFYKYNAAGQIESVTNDSTLVTPVVLNAPELYLIKIGSTEVKLSWGGVADATGYKIKYGTSSGNYTTTLDVGVAQSRVITQLTNNTPYYFVILAYNAKTQSSNSNERSATPVAPEVITMPSPWIQYTLNDNADTVTVSDTGSGTHHALAEQTATHTADLTGNGTASASSYLNRGDCDGGPCYPRRSFDNDFTRWDGWVADGTKSGWLAYEFSAAKKINRYTIAPRGHIYPNDDGNPRTWIFEGLNSSGWDVLDTRSFSSWTWKSPVTFDFVNDTAYQKYRLNISVNGGHAEVGLTEMEMMAYAPLFTSTLASSGKINGAFHFNGTSHLVNADSLLDIRNHSVGSLSLWLNPDSPSVDDVVFSMGDTDGSNRIELRAANDLEFYIVNSVTALRVSLPNALIAGLWSHIVISQDGQGIKGYVNGREATVTVLDQGLGLNAWFNSTWAIDNARIGCMKNNNQSNYNYYAGRLDDLRYYHYPLKAAEVKALYNGGSGSEVRNPQYTQYTPLSKPRFAPQEKTEQLASLKNVNELENSDLKSTPKISSLKISIVNVLAWIERHLWGVGEAQAQPVLQIRANPRKNVNQDPGNTTKSKNISQDAGSNTAKSLRAPPLSPVLYTAVAGDSKVTLSWSAVKHAVGYKVYYGTMSRAYNSSSNIGLANTITINNLTNGMKYYFALRAYNANGSSAVSNELNAIIPPARPVLRAAIAGDKQVRLSWDAASGARGYKIYYGTNPLALSTLLTVGNITTATVMGLTNGTMYYFVVSAANANSESVRSNTLNARPAIPPPSTPVLNTATPANGRVTLTWRAVTGATGYKVRYGTTSRTYTTTFNVGKLTSYSVTGLTNGKRYYFTVSAYNTTHESVNSNEQSALPTIAPFTTTLEAETMPTKTAGGPIKGGWIFWKNGYIEDTITFPRNATYEFEFVVRSSKAAGLWANMQLRLDQVAQADIGVPTATWRSFIKRVSVTSGSHRVAVALTNHYLSSSEGRNLFVDKVIIREVASSPPSAPILKSPVVSDAKVHLSWDPVVGAIGYKIRYGTTSGSYPTTINVGAASSYSVAGLTNGTMYYFVVIAMNTAGDGATSNEVNATPRVPTTQDATLFVKDIDYNAAGQMTKIEYGNGNVTTYMYHPLSLRLTRLYTLDKNGTALQDLNYTYDSVGNILSIDDKVNTADQAFQYDELNRLTKATGQQYGTKTYLYDAIGNIVRKDGKTYFYGKAPTASPHAVTALSDGTTFTYDANGNMTAKIEGGVATSYTYDAENRLIEVKKTGSIIGKYEYDGDGGRTKKTATVSGATTTFVGSLFESSGSRTTKFIFLGDQRVASITSSPTLGVNVLYYHADHLGSPNVLTDSIGFKKELIEYEPFGLESRHEKYGSSEEVAWYYFTGKKTDDESGLIYFQARYYDPTVGRFTSPDSLVPRPGNPQEFNRYSYAGNNPVNNIDPDGHSWKSFWKSLVGGVIGAAVGIISGNPWLGFAAYNAFSAGINGGNIGAAAGGALIGYFGGGLIGNAFGTFWGTLGAGALGGAMGAGIGGGDVGLAALSGLGGSWAGYGIGAATGFVGLGTIIGGGVSSEISGGDFGEGALGGLAYNVGFTLGSTVASWNYQPNETANIPEDSQVFFAGERLGKGQGLKGLVYNVGMAVLDPGPFNHTGIGAGNGQVIDSHPDAGLLDGPGVRSVKDFEAYQNDRVRTIQHKPGLTKAANNLRIDLKSQGVGFGGMPLTGTTGVYCSQFTGQGRQAAGQTGVYGKGPNSQYWYSYK